MRLVRLIFTALTLLASAPLPSNAQSQAEMNMEAGKRLEKADAELNKVYKQLLAQNTEDKEFSTAIKESQRAWLKFVETQMKVLFFVKEGENPREVYGSVYPTEFAEAKARLVNARIKDLREMLNE